MVRQVCVRSCVVFALALVGLGAGGNVPSLVEAVKSGDAAALATMIRSKVDVNAPTVDGTTALHWAAYKNDVAAVDALLRAGANVNATNRYGVAPISLASQTGNPILIERLLAAGANANSTQPGGETALMTAARTGNAAAVKMLLGYGADPNARETWKHQTALMWAAAANNAAAVDVLLEGGADLNARSRLSRSFDVRSFGDKGFTPLLFAARAGAIDAIRELLQHGADPNDALMNHTSALVLAVMAAQFDTASFLLEHGADPNAAGQGWTALHQLVMIRRPNTGLNGIVPGPHGEVDSLTLAKQLIAHGANVNAKMTKPMVTIWTGRNSMNRIGATPFFLAVSRFDLEMMQTLVALGADPLISNEDGTTPLMVAAGLGVWNLGENPGTIEEVTEAVKFCLELGNDPAAANFGGETALHGAAFVGADEAIKILVEAGAKLDARNFRGWTPLRIAAGVNVHNNLFVATETQALIERLMQEQGLPPETLSPTPPEADDLGPQTDAGKKSLDAKLKEFEAEDRRFEQERLERWKRIQQEQQQH